MANIVVDREENMGRTNIFLKGSSVSIMCVILLLALEPVVVAQKDDSEDDFDKRIEFLMNIGRFPSVSACIIKNDTVVWSQGYGYYNIEEQLVPDGNTIYTVASTSKAFAATALLQLYEQGYFDLDDDVNTFLNFSLRNPRYPDMPITFRMLLAHQSGLSHDTTRTILIHALFRGVIPYEWGLKELLVPGGTFYRPSIWTRYKPGDHYEYSNNGYAVVGHLVEKISNQTYEDYVKEHIFEPLDMKNSCFVLSLDEKEQYAVPYLRILRCFIALPYFCIPFYSSAGLKTTIEDLSHFLIAHMNDGIYNETRLLQKETVAEMHKIQYPDSVSIYGFQYGLGWVIWDRNNEMYQGHDGDTFGCASTMEFRTTDKIGVIFFINLHTANNPWEFTIERFIRNELYEKGEQL